MPTPLIYPDLDTAVRTQLSSGPARLAIEHAGEPSTRKALAAAFAGSRQPDGSYRQDNAFRYLIAGRDHIYRGSHRPSSAIHGLPVLGPAVAPRSGPALSAGGVSARRTPGRAG